MLAPLDAVDTDGRQISVPISDIRGLSPDDDATEGTLVFLDQAVVKVREPYEVLIERLAAGWDTRSLTAARAASAEADKKSKP